MKEEQLVSVIIPTFNREKTIYRAVMSVLNQTYKNLELIVVDDCSTDGTVEILSRIEDDRLNTVVLEQNGGACLARNYGIKLAKGEIITFQDSDDTWRETFIELMLSTLAKKGSDIVFCRMARHDLEGNAKEYPMLPEGMISHKTLISRSWISTQTMLGKAICFKDTLFDVGMPRLQDFDLVIRLSGKYKMFHLNDVLVDVYLQDDSLSNSIIKHIMALERIITKYEDVWRKYPDLEAKHLDALAMSYVRNGQRKRRLFLLAFKKNRNIRRLIKLVVFSLLPSPICKRITNNFV